MVKTWQWERYSILSESVLASEDLEHVRWLTTNKGATIGHGIKARTFAGQASSEFSHQYFAGIKQALDLAWSMVEEQQQELARQNQAKL